MKKQPDPKEENTEPEVVPLVVHDLQERYESGLKSYGVPLKPFNGRNALQDLYEEMLDSVLYLRQLLHEEEVERNSMTFEELLAEYNKLSELYIRESMLVSFAENALKIIFDTTGDERANRALSEIASWKEEEHVE